MTVPSWAVRGAKVVCVAEPWLARRLDYRFVKLPQIGATYTIERAFVAKNRFAGMPSLILAEVPSHYLGRQYGFDLSAFRPLVTRSIEDDLAIFRPILDQVPEAA